MAKTPILGSAYVTRSPNAANAEMINLYPEVIPEGGKEPGYLLRCPGLKNKITVGTGPIRGMWELGQNTYVVSGIELYRVNSNLGYLKLGNVASGGPVSMADNGTQIFVACNGPSYIYNTNTLTFQQITDPDFPGAVTVGYLNGVFVFNEPFSQRVWTTAILNGTDIDALDFASAEGDSDNIVGLIIDHQEAWLFGTKTVEVFYFVGGTDFPLARIQGAFNEIGCVAPYSIAKMDNGLFWLGGDRRGQGIVYRANGYKGQRISTHAVEWQIQQYHDMSDAIGYTYQQDGHSFYVLVFPSANATWVYDVATQNWHKRAGWDTNLGQFTRHRGNCQVNFNGMTLIGDCENGDIYEFDAETYSDNGQIQKWLRTWRALPTGQNNMRRTAQHSLQIDMETGVGLDGLGQGTDPQVMLRWSDDGGHTWTSTKYAGIGRIGEFFKRVFFRRLGMTNKLRDRVFELSGTDPVKIAIMGAELTADGTNA